MKNIKIGDHVKVVKIPEDCREHGPICEYCLGNTGYWTERGPNDRDILEGIFIYEKKASDGCSRCNALRPEHLAPFCKLQRSRKNR